MTEWKSRYHLWKKQLHNFDEALTFLEEMGKDDALVEDSFYRELSFGTSGLRGIMGIGTNRMNTFVVAKATKGLSSYILSKRYSKGDKCKPKVIISYDNRNNSRKFANATALVLANEGIEALIFENMTAVPILSFAIRNLGCDFGVMITASHNNKIYNGYKVYNDRGYQILDNEAEDILGFIEKTDIFDENLMKINKIIRELDEEKVIGGSYHENITVLNDANEDKYIQCLSKEFNWLSGDLENIELSYSPLYGTGRRPITKLLEKEGIKKIHKVDLQWEENGDFPTCPDPNPEYEETYREAIKIMERFSADAAIVTDPDCDRIGLATGNRVFTGNQVATLLSWYIKEQLLLNDRKDEIKNYKVLRSIVSSPLIEKIVEAEGAGVEETLIGFKYMGEKLEELSLKGKKLFIAFEEGNGFLLSQLIRDKDGISTAFLLAKLVAYCKDINKSLDQILSEVYESYGYYLEKTVNYVFEGYEGSKLMDSFMDNLRNRKNDLIDIFKANSLFDYFEGTENFDDGKVKESKLQLPKSNILELRGEDWKLIIRKSGTEPKLKVYIICWDKVEYNLSQKSKGLLKKVNEMVEEYKDYEK